jgi:uridine kinase
MKRSRQGMAFESVSSWKQPEPPSISPTRTRIIEDVAERICRLSPARLRVAIDGYTAAGKTSFGHELAAAIRRRGRTTMRASLDDFKNPWKEARERGYDRLSGEGYYRNAYDFHSIRNVLLGPSGPNGSGQVVLCAHDPLTGADHRDKTITASDDAILIVDSVFAFRPEYNDLWDYRIWIDVDAETALKRGIERDTDREGRDEATLVHRERYAASELIYVAEVHPQSLADIIIGNRDLRNPQILSVKGGS